MSLETVERELETWIRSSFETAYGVPVDYGQDGFQKSDKWVRATILGGLEVGLEISGSSFETSGALECQVFTRKRRDNARIYDQLADALRQKQINGVLTLDPQRIVVGARDGWWQTNLSVEWEIET